jgi:hypothetical protein
VPESARRLSNSVQQPMLCGEESRSIILTRTPERQQRPLPHSPLPSPPDPTAPAAVGRGRTADTPTRRFCTGCGAAIKAQQQFCIGCGKRLV